MDSNYPEKKIWGEFDDRSSLEYLKFDPVPNSLAITPYFGIGGEDAEETKLHYPHLTGTARIAYPFYLLKCIFSLSKYFQTIIVSCQNQKDYDDLYRIKDIFNLNIAIMYIESESIFLPINTLKHIQTLELYKNYDYIFYTECDQMPFFDTGHVLSQLDRETVVSFHRFIRRYIKEEITPKQFHTQLTAYFDNLEYFVCCLSHAQEINKDFTMHTDEGGAYGAAYLCTSECFGDIEFLYSDSCPCEYASHSVYRSSKIVLKTTDVYKAFVVHLSGLNEHLKLNNLSVIDFPNLW